MHMWEKELPLVLDIMIFGLIVEAWCEWEVNMEMWGDSHLKLWE